MTTPAQFVRPLKPGLLVAVLTLSGRVRRIARVVEDRGEPWLVTVETDDKLEGEAAIEYDFPTPDSEVIQVDFERLQPIFEEGEQ